MKKPYLQNSNLTGKGFYLLVACQYNLLRIFVRWAIKPDFQNTYSLEAFKYLDSDMQFIKSFDI